MLIALPVAGPVSGTGGCIRPRQSAGACWGISQSKRVGVSSAGLAGAHEQTLVARVPASDASGSGVPCGPIGAIPFDGEHSCDPSDAGDRSGTTPRQTRMIAWATKRLRRPTRELRIWRQGAHRRIYEHSAGGAG